MAIVNFGDGAVTVQLSLDAAHQVDVFVDEFIEQWRTEQHKQTNYMLRRGITSVDETSLMSMVRDTTRLGFMGELAVAEYVGYPYELRVIAGYDGTTDVDGIEVRTVDTFTKRLITHSYDKPAPYVLAVADHGTATVVLRGWALLYECNVAAHWWADAPHPAYFTDPTLLHPMGMLLTAYKLKRATVNNGV